MEIEEWKCPCLSSLGYCNELLKVLALAAWSGFCVFPWKAGGQPPELALPGQLCSGCTDSVLFLFSLRLLPQQDSLCPVPREPCPAKLPRKGWDAQRSGTEPSPCIPCGIGSASSSWGGLLGSVSPLRCIPPRRCRRVCGSFCSTHSLRSGSGEAAAL